MASGQSTLERTTLFVRQLTSLLNTHAGETSDRNLQRLLNTLKRVAADARLDVRDYEMADTKAEMISHGRSAATRFEEIRAGILKVSESGLFSAIDVAQLTAEIEGIIGEIKESL